MKAATGELSLTLITVVAIGLVLALFTAIVWPSIRDRITGTFDEDNGDFENLEGERSKLGGYLDEEFSEYFVF